jgi:ABC-2 type transport system ATP-binding protein
MENNAAIQAQELSKDFGVVKALDAVDLTVAAGQIFGLLGPNGAGKTTLIRSLVGATKPTGGHIRLLGLDPLKDKARLRRKIGYMPQSPALYDDLSPAENIRFFGRGQGLQNVRERVAEVIDFVGLSARAEHPVHTLSGGMKQRVSLACALVNNPEVLFLDEPTAGVDPKLRESFWRHFRALADRGVLVIVSTHLMDDAMVADRLAVLSGGRILAEDTPRNLLWENRATVRIWRGADAEEHVLAQYPDALPNVLQKDGLNPAITRIEINEEGLEQVVLRLVHQADAEAGGGDEV